MSANYLSCKDLSIAIGFEGEFGGVMSMYKALGIYEFCSYGYFVTKVVTGKRIGAELCGQISDRLNLFANANKGY